MTAPSAEFLYGRTAQLLVARPREDSFRDGGQNALVIEDLRFRFRVEKTIRKEPNTAEITITNLGPDTRARLNEKYLRVFLQAGYSEPATVFVGDVRRVIHRREGPDWETKIEAGDAERAIAHARLNRSYRGKVRLDAVLKDAAGVMGRAISGVLPASLQTKTLGNGFAARGRASHTLDRVLHAHGFEWSIQDGRLQILDSGAASTEQAVVLAPDSGLVGSPELGTPEKKGGKSLVTAKTLLRPELKAGGRVIVESAGTGRGTYRIVTLRHEGDTRGQDWYTTVEAELL